ncbi:MAG: ACP S-malonyltransferase [Nitrospiraceae bacterium]|jgi:[acyl-carrier-protein] S-malonyltransferase|uniref:ACP S-malonyltransferase n=1 Tax=Nitrospira cf. moscoviensis SBR1015 TaxID=96242 RepID=UPI000A0C247C|nr:ACP S-malonyltransferase [Nitrospira cf. moscoviensis SBR1015]MBY0246439.1 ACP S-malonyltransferase [Nitrospiraceae bacterium]OQW34990.1 MAG: malonyl CoA-acyl carrier protein transacylase [Nitrospira sp. SG-bin2]
MASGIGLVFPGQGSQSVGMGKSLCEAHPAIKQVYEEASAVLGYDSAALCFEGPAERLNLTEYTQPALLVSSIAALKTLESAGIQPIAVAGHSLGEYSALVAVGGVSFRDAVGLVQKRGRYMSEAVAPGTGLVAALLGLTPDVVKDVCREASVVGVVAAANFNSPGQVVIAGEKAAVERAIELAKEKGCKKAIPLPVSVPVHTPLMQRAADRLATDLAAIRWSDLRAPLINNAEARAISRANEIHASLVKQLPSSVLWEDTVRTMGTMGVTTFVEVGPGAVLTGLIKRILPEARLMNVNDPKSLEATLNNVNR